MAIKVLDEENNKDKITQSVFVGDTFKYYGKLFICSRKTAFDGITALCLSENGREYRFTNDREVTPVNIEVKIVN